jgi:hypothetical protein
MIRATLLALSIASASAAQPGQSAQSSPIQAGTYDLRITYGGGLLDATLEIGFKGDSITAVLKLGDHQSPVKPGKRTGNKLALEPVSPSMDVRYDLEFTGERVKGTFRYDGQEGVVTGLRRRAER